MVTQAGGILGTGCGTKGGGTSGTLHSHDGTAVVAPWGHIEDNTVIFGVGTLGMLPRGGCMLGTLLGHGDSAVVALYGHSGDKVAPWG